MAEIITLHDGIRVEAEVTDARVSLRDGKVEQTLEAIKPVLIKAVQPVVSAWRELRQDMIVDGADIELGFGFEASGSVFLASTKGNVNLKITLKLKPA